jgi:hypothetical protein
MEGGAVGHNFKRDTPREKLDCLNAVYIILEMSLIVMSVFFFRFRLYGV